MIGFDEPFGEGLVAHFVESSEHDDDVGERFFTESGELGECGSPDPAAYGDHPTTSWVSSAVIDRLDVL